MSSEFSVLVEGLTKTYSLDASPRGLWTSIRRKDPARQVQAVHDVSFGVRRGETFGIMGRNGSGKSTLLEMIVGTLTPTGGSVTVDGRIAALLQLGAGFHPDLSGRENVHINGAVLGLTREELAERFPAIVDFAELHDYIEQPVRTYSTGMFVRLAFAVAISVDPEILIIDEALSVGDEAFQRKCFARIEQIRDNGATVLFVSHAALTVMRICDRAMLLDRGERLLIADPKTVVARYHQLIYAPPADAEEIRRQILALDRAGDAAPPGVAAEEQPRVARRALEEEAFDPQMRPKSTLSYVPRGALIRDVRILNEADKQVNVLRRGGRYVYEYVVRFDADAARVRFGMLIKTVDGADLGGLTSHPPEAPLQRVEAGREVLVRMSFCARMAPGTYFTNAGVTGLIDGSDQYLHRLIDALQIRVIPETGLCVTVSVDFSTEEEAVVLDAPAAPQAFQADGEG